MAKAATRSSSSKKLQVVEHPKAAIIEDYRVAFLSRQASLVGRKEVLTGKAKFGIFGDGKEVAQLAMARAFRKGDWRSGYYRDQTFMFALGALTVRQFFAQLYADTELANEPATGGRQMNAHFATRYLDEGGAWLNQCMMYNSAADLSPTAAQMARLVGLGYASKLYRQNKTLSEFSQFSLNGNEVAFGTIGNASTSEGVFWESLNAAGVLQIPLAISVWDDHYGISVPARFQTTKESISDIVAGFAPDATRHGVKIHVVKGWDYPALVETYQSAIEETRKFHSPCLIHVIEMTQPQGHSTSGSHERYKTKERLELEAELDCMKKMREWLLSEGYATSDALEKLEQQALEEVETERRAAWADWGQPIERERADLLGILSEIESSDAAEFIARETQILQRAPTLLRRTIQSAAVRILAELRHEPEAKKERLRHFIDTYSAANAERYNTHVCVSSARSPLQIEEVKKVYAENPEMVPGHQIIQWFFEKAMEKDPRIFIIGEDVGHLGGVNSEFKGLQDRFGELRVTDTGIREATILGQGLGAAMRGLKPIVDIQYLDYLLYCFQVMSDDLATLHYRSAGGQTAPCIVRTKGHRLEGIWHTGSPMGTIIHGLRGIHVCVPRDMTQAAGMYNTLLKGDDPALVIEVLNAYRVKEALPENLGEYTVPLGVPEVVAEGSDVTIVTYGACVRIALDAMTTLTRLGISVELIDIQTLLPFDVNHVIARSLEKTNAVLFLDEDVPGGASAFMMQQVLELQKGYDCLDGAPRTLTAKPHRAAYASDGDYFSKPNAEDIFTLVYEMMRERDPERFPAI